MDVIVGLAELGGLSTPKNIGKKQEPAAHILLRHPREPHTELRNKRRSTTMQFPPLVERVRGEFIEMPGLQLTIAQAARLWGLDLTASRNVVDVLVESAFLRWTAGGKIVRATT